MYFKHAAYISDVSGDIIKDLIMTGLYKNNSFLKLDTFMIPVKDIQEFITSYLTLEEYLRARYRIIFSYLSRCITEIHNKIPYNDEIQHVFFIKEYKKTDF